MQTPRRRGRSHTRDVRLGAMRGRTAGGPGDSRGSSDPCGRGPLSRSRSLAQAQDRRGRRPAADHRSTISTSLSYQRFCLLQHAITVPDRNTIWRFAQRIGVDGATALSQGVDAQLQRHGYIARGGQAIDATLVPAPRQHIGKEDKERLAQGKEPDWSEAKRRQKDLDATHTKKHGRSHFGYKLSVSADLKHGFVRKIVGRSLWPATHGAFSGPSQSLGDQPAPCAAPPHGVPASAGPGNGGVCCRDQPRKRKSDFQRH